MVRFLTSMVPCFFFAPYLEFSYASQLINSAGKFTSSEGNLFQFSSKTKHTPATGKAVILAAISSVALVTFSLPSVAQPNALNTGKTPDKTGFVLGDQKRETFRKFVDLTNMENVCKRQIDLKVTDATLEDVIAKVKAALPSNPRIEVRHTSPVRVSFDLKETTVGNALQSVSALAGSKLWVFDDHLLISPSERLTASESANVEAQSGGEWLRNVASGGTGWYAQSKGRTALLSAMVDVFDQQRGLAHTATTPGLINKNNGLAATVQIPGSPTPVDGNKAPQSGVVTVTFGELSPDAQAIMTQLVAWNMDNSRRNNPHFVPLILEPNAKVIFDDSKPNRVSLSVRPIADSDQHPTITGWTLSR